MQEPSVHSGKGMTFIPVTEVTFAKLQKKKPQTFLPLVLAVVPEK